MGEVAISTPIAEVEPVNIVAEGHKNKEEKNKARDAKKKAAEEEKRRMKEEEEKQKREHCLQRANELRRQLQGHHVITPNINSQPKQNLQSQAPNVPAKAHVVAAPSVNLVPNGAHKKSVINGHMQSQSPRGPVKSNVTPDTAALAKSIPISTTDASKRPSTLVKANVGVVPVASATMPAGASKKPEINGHPQSQTPRTPAALPKAAPVSTTDVSKRSVVSGHSQSQAPLTPVNVKQVETPAPVTLAPSTTMPTISSTNLAAQNAPVKIALAPYRGTRAPVTLARTMPTSSTTVAAQTAPVKIALTPVRVAPTKSVPVTKTDAPKVSEVSHQSQPAAAVTFVPSVTTSTAEISFVVGQVLVKANIDVKINSGGFVLKEEINGARVQDSGRSNASTSQRAAEDQKNQGSNNNAAALPNKTNTAPATTTNVESSNNNVRLTNLSENDKKTVAVPHTKNANCVSSELRKPPYVDHRPLNHSTAARNYYDVYNQPELQYQAAQNYYPWRIDDRSDQKYHGSRRRVTNGLEQKYNGNGRRFTKGGGQESQKDKKWMPKITVSTSK